MSGREAFVNFSAMVNRVTHGMAVEFEAEGLMLVRASGVKSLDRILFNGLKPREGSTWVASDPPLALANSISAEGGGQNFPLFSKVVADKLLPAGCSAMAINGLSGPMFSGPIACGGFGAQL
ncbi:hypothetical protein GALL_400720 [mine drainage metagenome]|uniref:Uncharacterized protein n=1 Tax=mine drainage metagenome TaxID=410659 RepID=A0A1J5Q3G8_9ZZZZ